MECQLISKMCCFQLVEVMYSRLPKEDVNTKNSKINAAFCKNTGATGNELTKAITKQVFLIFTASINSVIINHTFILM